MLIRRWANSQFYGSAKSDNMDLAVLMELAGVQIQGGVGGVHTPQ